MVELVRVFAEARALREEAERARRLARTTSSRLPDGLHQIAVLYDKLVDGEARRHVMRGVEGKSAAGTRG
jgi:hypothetical protein